MKKSFYLLFILLSILSCKQNTEEKPEPVELQPMVSVDELMADHVNWWAYQYYDISLSSNFKPLDTNSNALSKEKFLTKLTSGEYVPIEMKADSAKVYKLYEIPATADKSIKETIKSLAASELHFFKMEGTDFPDFEATSLEDKMVNSSSLKGKTTVLKTWFIACKPCVAEMPVLNKVVDKYQKEDVQFISLALDKAPQLKTFLESQEFKYTVLPEQKDLIQNELKLNAYPTHLVIDKSGKIEKVFSKGTDLIAYLENHTALKAQDHNSKLPPPPPPPPAPVKESA
ncbi:MAG TPA: TlpA disulfide reductase family protein [Christiangramia sp.]|nr:TlpA disulfide reductase family protein [Christiangramia sp.]